MPIKIIGCKGVSVTDDGMVAVQCDCKCSNIGEDASDQKAIFIRDMTKIMKTLSYAENNKFKLDLCISAASLDELQSKVAAAQDGKRKRRK